MGWSWKTKHVNGHASGLSCQLKTKHVNGHASGLSCQLLRKEEGGKRLNLKAKEHLDTCQKIKATSVRLRVTQHAMDVAH